MFDLTYIGYIALAAIISAFLSGFGVVIAQRNEARRELADLEEDYQELLTAYTAVQGRPYPKNNEGWPR